MAAARTAWEYRLSRTLWRRYRAEPWFNPPGNSLDPMRTALSFSVELRTLDYTPIIRCGLRNGRLRRFGCSTPALGHIYLRSAGRGDGPGEFQRSSFLGFDAEGSAYVYDYRHRRVSVFSEHGELQRTDLMPSWLGVGPRPLHVTHTGVLLGQIPEGMERTPADGSTVRDTVKIWTMPLDGEPPNLVWKAPGALWYFQDGMSVVVPYTGNLPPPYAGGSSFGFWDDRIYATDDAGESSYSVYGPAGLERKVEIDRVFRQASDFSATLFVEYMRQRRFPESLLEIYEDHLADMPIPNAHRAWDALVVTNEGGAWLLRASTDDAPTASADAEDRVWDVFDAEGVFGGHVRLPPDVGLVHVSGESTVTIVSGELGRVTVGVHDVRWIGRS